MGSFIYSPIYINKNKMLTSVFVLIYDNESMETFHDGCDLIRGPVNGNGDENGNCVVYENIGGDSSIETTVQPSLEVCQGLCKLTSSGDGVPATYFTYSKESQACECFTKGTRDCYVKYVVSGAE